MSFSQKVLFLNTSRRCLRSPWQTETYSFSDIVYKKTKLAPLQERRMIDRFRVWAKGGDGGNGCTSIRRSRHDRRGRPDGGNGGRGGDVILECSPIVWDLSGLQHHINAKRGGNGSSKNMIGSRGADKFVELQVQLFLCCHERVLCSLSRCIATSPLCRLKSSTVEPRSCVPKLHGFSKKLLPLCKEMCATSNRERSITCSASQVDTAADKPVSLTYKDAGVDIDAGSELVRRIAKMAPGIGGFGGLFPLGDSYLVAGTDGVGTKLKLAFETGIHHTIGIDLVAMSVNDIVTSGAKPLFFLDYFATSRLDVDLAEKVIKGIVDGCQQSDCALLGGETAEMPDFYAEGEYDLSGFAVGIVKKDSVINGKSIKVGDVLIGLPSSGVHSNGFSLVRRVLKQSGLSLKDQLPGATITLGEALMAPTVIYVKQVLDIINNKGGVKGIAHVTGGGFTDNIPRVFPEGLGATIYKDSWAVPPVFKWIQEAGRIEDAEMRRTFNMGIGMVLVVSPEAADRILGEGQNTSIAYRIGEVVKGDGVSYN